MSRSETIDNLDDYVVISALNLGRSLVIGAGLGKARMGESNDYDGDPTGQFNGH